jgi:hypothetical protein
VLLALHQFFLSQSRSPVPGFLVLDQPSQVYFPKRIVARPEDEEDEEVEEPRLRDEDVDAIRKAFEVMGHVALAAKGSLQLLVLDHASHDVWGDIDGVASLPEWRNGVKLVPEAWLVNARPFSSEASGPG